MTRTASQLPRLLVAQLRKKIEPDPAVPKCHEQPPQPRGPRPKIC